MISRCIFLKKNWISIIFGSIEPIGKNYLILTFAGIIVYNLLNFYL